ncbi:hypothetical protein ACKF11_13365 [Methylobacillus sp. Pita2]|uniref:hypothetical protein n=1 Tax=Methylobacillus sp. Pita2 TaxID=3383245 RepID=UPI0038B4C8F8
MIMEPTSTAVYVGKKGTPHSAEELELFLAYMRAHSWDPGEWDSESQSFTDHGTRMLYGVFRDRGQIERLSGNFKDSPKPEGRTTGVKLTEAITTDILATGYAVSGYLLHNPSTNNFVLVNGDANRLLWSTEVDKLMGTTLSNQKDS